MQNQLTRTLLRWDTHPYFSERINPDIRIWITSETRCYNQELKLKEIDIPQ